MRGKLILSIVFFLKLGITPAHAGKTFSNFSRSTSTRDHPRACGENILFPAFRNLFLGSPPRMRGKRVDKGIFEFLLGITPAHAGKTHCIECRKSGFQDHPRACGENTAKSLRSFALTGSPPRMRGKRFITGFSCACARITPAHAGKTAGRKC